MSGGRLEKGSVQEISGPERAERMRRKRERGEVKLNGREEEEEEEDGWTDEGGETAAALVDRGRFLVHLRQDVSTPTPAPPGGRHRGEETLKRVHPSLQIRVSRTEQSHSSGSRRTPGPAQTTAHRNDGLLISVKTLGVH